MKAKSIAVCLLMALLSVSFASVFAQNGLWGSKYEDAKRISESTLVVVLDDNENEPYNRVVRPVFEKEWTVSKVIFVSFNGLSAIVPQPQYTIFRPVITGSGKTGLGIFGGEEDYDQLYIKNALAMCNISHNQRAESTFDYYRPAILLMQDLINYGLENPNLRKFKPQGFNKYLRQQEVIYAQKDILVPRNVVYNEPKFYKRLEKVYPYSERVQLVPEPLITKAIKQKDPTVLYVKFIPNDLFAFFEASTGKCLFLAVDRDAFGLQPDYFKGLLKTEEGPGKKAKK